MMMMMMMMMIIIIIIIILLFLLLLLLQDATVIPLQNVIGLVLLHKTHCHSSTVLNC